MLAVQPTRLQAGQPNESEEADFFDIDARLKDQKRLSKRLTNVFSSANQMTRSLVSQAATKTMSVTKTITNIQAMQLYNEKREAEIARAAAAMEEARKERLKMEEAR